MAVEKKDPEKTVDLPPHGNRNPDPITDAPGSHPVEVGLGAALGGAASGFAVGMVAGPVGAAIGAVVGAVGGGYAGKGVGELIDPTTEDNWLREYVASEPAKAHVRTGESEDTYRPAYHYGVEAAAQHAGKRFEDVEADLRAGWDKRRGPSDPGWDQAGGAVRDAFGRTVKLHEERLKVTKEQVKTGEVEVRKEVITEHKTVTVPVEREEIVVERRAVADGATGGAVQAEVTRIPVSEEKVTVSKETVVKEEVKVGKRTVQGTETVAGDVRKEELKVDTDGDAKVRKG